MPKFIIYTGSNIEEVKTFVKATSDVYKAARKNMLFICHRNAWMTQHKAFILNVGDALYDLGHDFVVAPKANPER